MKGERETEKIFLERVEQNEALCAASHQIRFWAIQLGADQNPVLFTVSLPVSVLLENSYTEVADDSEAAYLS